MIKVYNFFGGPGTGKSTSASMFFALLKENGFNAELINEYVKQWAWENRKPVKYDQFYFFGKQARKEYSLFPNVEHIVTDSPVALCGYYAQIFGTPAQALCFRQMTETYLDMCKADGVEHINILLKRVKPYNPKGRFQTEEQAKNIDLEMKYYIKSLGLEFVEITGDREGIENYFKWRRDNERVLD